jgi:N-glycosylase/DNA lyase
LTKATYDAIGDHFRSLWGKEAGWAHSVLFTADLRAFAERLGTETEAKGEDVGGGEAVADVSETTIKAETLSSLASKRGIEEDPATSCAEEPASKRVKRRR